MTAAGLLLVGPLQEGRIVRWDLHLEQWPVDHRTKMLNTLAEAGMWLAETITVPVVLLIAIVIAWRVSSNVAAPALLAVAVGGETPRRPPPDGRQTARQGGGARRSARVAMSSCTALLPRR